MSDSDSDLLPGLWSKLPEHAGMILGTEVSLGARAVERDFELPAQAYCAALQSKDEPGPAAWVVFEVGVAVAAGGVLVMRPEDVIKQRVQEAQLEEDDLDAMGEFVNQLMAPFNDSLKAMGLESTPHFVFGGGGIEQEHRPSGDVIAIGGPIEVGGVHEGNFWFVLPLALLGEDSASAEPDPADVTSDGGVDLSPEELEAIRAATQEAAEASVGRTLFVVPLARERDEWAELLGEAGFDYEFATDLAAMRRALATGAFGAVVVDADACAAGGLPFLAVTRDGGGRIPAVVVASAPTRTHLVSCVAAGASTYLTKPLEPSQLLDSVESVRRYD